MSEAVSDFTNLFYLFDFAIAARTLYCFCRAYFAHKLRKDDQSVPLLPPTLPDASKRPPPVKKKKLVRVYMDGCFDAMHFGHANALRQAKALGDVLIVGINSSSEILKHKGPPVMTDEERRIAVSSVKWVDEVLTDVPYVVTPQFLEALIKQHRIDIIVHGDDPCVGADGRDVYEAVKRMGRFRTIKRTEGVSSTDIVGRMLLCTRDHHVGLEPSSIIDTVEVEPMNGNACTALSNGKPFLRPSTFLPTTRRLIQFAGQTRAPQQGDRVVYCGGTFDMFHAGHIETLRKAKKFGDFLLVGIHDDVTVNERRGSNFPIMNLHERTLAVLSCRYVDEVIIGAPWSVSEDMVKTMNITTVVHGSHRGDSKSMERYTDPYKVPRKMNILREVESESDLSVHVILNRIEKNRKAFVTRNVKKEAAETEYLTKHKTYVEER